MSKPILRIILDERVDKIDERTCRVIFSAVEIPESVDLEKIKTDIRSMECHDRRTKLHFTDISQKSRDRVVNYISSLNIRVKIYAYYSFNQTQKLAKQKALVWVIDKTKKSMSKNTLEFRIERAEEYGSIVKTQNIIDDAALTILPDAFCYVFARRLDISKMSPKISCKLIDKRLRSLDTHKRLAIQDNFNMLREQIRLEGYLYCDSKPRYLQRGNKVG